MALASRRFRLLGADFLFETGHAALTALVEQAYASLPAHVLSPVVPRLRLSLAVAPRRRARTPLRAGVQRPPATGAPRIETLSGAGLLCGAAGSSSFAAISPAEHTALIVVSPDMLRHAYHVRYELIEFAVYTLATRAQGLVPLHAACLGRAGRGLLVMGDSGAGKSTTALHGALRGLEFVAEDSVLVTPGSLVATGVANFLHLRRDALRFLPPGVAARFGRAPVIRRRSGVGKLEIDLRESGLPLAQRPVRIEGVVFATPRSAESGPMLAPLSRKAARQRLARAQPYAAHRPEWPGFAARVGELPAFELRRGGHPREAADALASLLAVAPLAAARRAAR